MSSVLSILQGWDVEAGEVMTSAVTPGVTAAGMAVSEVTAAVVAGSVVTEATSVVASGARLEGMTPASHPQFSWSAGHPAKVSTQVFSSSPQY